MLKRTVDRRDFPEWKVVMRGNCRLGQGILTVGAYFILLVKVVEWSSQFVALGLLGTWESCERGARGKTTVRRKSEKLG